MRHAALACLLLATVIAQTGCTAFGCGAFEGSGNRVYERSGTEMLIVCDNGGFVARLTTGTIEGTYLDNEDGTGLALRGEDGELAFDTQQNGDATLSTPQLGATTWTQMSLDATALDHSDVLCHDLESRAWWTAR